MLMSQCLQSVFTMLNMCLLNLFDVTMFSQYFIMFSQCWICVLLDLFDVKMFSQYFHIFFTMFSNFEYVFEWIYLKSQCFHSVFTMFSQCWICALLDLMSQCFHNVLQCYHNVFTMLNMCLNGLHLRAGVLCAKFENSVSKSGLAQRENIYINKYKTNGKTNTNINTKNSKIQMYLGWIYLVLLFNLQFMFPISVFDFPNSTNTLFLISRTLILHFPISSDFALVRNIKRCRDMTYILQQGENAGIFLNLSFS